jgi:hypothetical protein
MKADVFGDLRDWGRVLSVLQLLEGKGRLDEVQEGLIRILNYRSNWRLREQALVSARRVVEPSGQLLQAVICVLRDESSYLDARILAAQTLACLAPRLPREYQGGDMTPGSIRQNLLQVVAKPEPPVLRQAVEKALESLGQLEQATESRQEDLGLGRRS